VTTGSQVEDAPALRADARRNRVRILRAARAAFAEEGIEVGVDEIARRAGVGVGTLYRRFPTKESLVAAIFEDRLADLEAAAEDALGGPDPAAAIEGFIEAAASMLAEDLGLVEMVEDGLPLDEVFADGKARLLSRLGDLVDRAKAGGAIRPDAVAEDLMVILLMLGHLIRRTPEDDPSAEGWRRYLRLLMQGLGADPGQPLPPPPELSRRGC
jgi:AcrR family transcriptional regulator